MTDHLSIGGSSFGPNAVGRGARAEQRDVAIHTTTAGDDRFAAALAELRRQFAQHRAEIPESDWVERDSKNLERSAQEPDPDPQNLRDTIKRIAGRVAMSAPVISAVNDVRQLIEAMAG